MSPLRYLVELFTKPNLQRSFLDEVVMGFVMLGLLVAFGFLKVFVIDPILKWRRKG